MIDKIPLNTMAEGKTDNATALAPRFWLKPISQVS